MPTLAGNKQLFHPSFPLKDAHFHLSTENGRSKSVRDGHQRVYSRAEVLFTVVKNIFPQWEKENFSSIGKIK